MPDDPQAAGEQRTAARHLLRRPLTCQEHDPERFRLIRRHEADLDRWFTQRLGYRLHIDTDTARLFKAGGTTLDRRLSTGDRSLSQREHTLLALLLASTAAGPAVISLRDLVAAVRAAAAEADVYLGTEATDRRAMVVALRWMVTNGLATELHANVDAYVTDASADAVLKIRPDRIVLLLMPALAGATTVDDLLARADRRETTRQWMRSRLVDDPVVYRDDLTDTEWGELRRRLGEEAAILDEMFGLRLEARAEGIAAIDPAGTLSDRRFPTTGSTGRAALLLLEALTTCDGMTEAKLTSALVAAVAQDQRGWSKETVAQPATTIRRALALLTDVRLVTAAGDASYTAAPAATRFVLETTAQAQEALW